MKKVLGFMVFLFACFSLSACSHTAKAKAVPLGKPLPYYQSYCFVADPASIKTALTNVLAKEKYEIEEDNGTQILALNPDLSSVEILTFALERPSALEAVYSGEIRLVIQVGKTAQGICLTIEPKIQAITGRPALFRNPTWKGKMQQFTSRGMLENELLKSIARELKDKKALAILVTRGIELEGGFTLP